MATLVVGIVAHALLGLGLAVGVWLVGGACLALARRGDPVDAYPFGLLAVVAAAALILVDGRFVLVCAPALAVLAVLGLRGKVGWARLAWALPPTAAFALVLGLLLHGPTDEVDSRAYGDMLFYVDRLVSAGQSIAPYRDLLAEGERLIYLEAGTSFVGAVLSHLPGFDPVLFHAVTLPAFMLAGLGVGIAVATRRAAPTAIGVSVVLALLAAAAIPYPSWVTESPPAAFAVPLAPSIYALWARPRSSGWSLVVAAVIAVDLLLTKVLAGLPFAVLAGAFLYARFVAGRPLRTVVLRVGIPAAIAFGAAIALVLLEARWYLELYEPKFLVLDALRGLRTQLDGADPQALGPAFTVAGELLLLVALFRVRAFALALALAVAVAGDWVGGRYGFDIAVGIVVVAAALLFRDEPERWRSASRLVTASALAFAGAAWLRELTGLRAGVVLVLLVTAALVAALRRPSAQEALAGAGVIAAAGAIAAGGFPSLAVLAAAAATIALLRAPRRRTVAVTFTALAALGAASLTRDASLSGSAVTLRRSDYELWRNVRERVPPRGLVFTHFTGYPIDHHHGWNNYASIAGRQLYVAGWYDTELRANPDELRRRLRTNRAVLEGRVPPRRVPLQRSYDSYYAVQWSFQPAPPSFRRVYANGSFAIYRIPSGTNSALK